MGAGAAVAQRERSPRRVGPQPAQALSAAAPGAPEAAPGVPQFLDTRQAGNEVVEEIAPGPDVGDTQASHQVAGELARSGAALEAGAPPQVEEPEEDTTEATEETSAASHRASADAGPSAPAASPAEAVQRRGGGGGGGGRGEGGEAGDGAAAEAGETAATEGEGGAEGADGGGGAAEGGGAGEAEGEGSGGAGGGGIEEGTGAGGGGGLAADAAAGTLESLATGDIALIDEELAEHQRWGAASARVGEAGSARRADFIVDQAGAGALGGFGHGALMGAAVGAGSQALEIGAARLVARLAGPALARSFPLPAIGAVIGGVFSAYDLATRDWGHTGETIGRFGEGGSIYEQLANSIAAVSEIIGIATAVLNVIAGVIGAISIAMWVITVLTVGVASPLAATLSTIAMAIGMATMVLDGINALVLQRLVTLFRALHTFTSQADPSDVEQQGGRIAAAAGASAGFVGGMAGGLAGGGATAAGARRLGIGHPPPHVPGVEPPRPAAGEGPTITADPPPAVEAGVPAGDRPAMLPPEPAAPRPASDPGLPAPGPVDPHAPTMPAPAPVDPHAPTMPAPAPANPHAPTMPAPAPVDPHAPTLPAPAPVDPHAPTMPAPAPVDPHAPTIPMPEVVDPHAPTALPSDGGMPEIPGPPRVPEFEPLPDYGPELPDWNPAEPSPYAPTERPPASPAEVVDPHASTIPAPEAIDPHASTIPAPEVVDPHAPTALPPDGGMPEIPGPPRVPEFEPLPDYGPELPDWNPDAPSPYAPTQPPPPLEAPTPSPSRAPTEPATPSRAPTEPVTPSQAPTEPAPRQITDAEVLPPPAAEPAPSADPASFADLADTVAALNDSPFGDRLASEAMAPMQDVPRDTARSPRAVHDAAYAQIPGDRPAGYGGPGLQDQHWTKVRDATINAAPGTRPATVEAINASRSPLQSRAAHPATLLLTTEGAPASALPGGERGTRYYVGDAPMGRPAVPEGPGNAAIPAEPGAAGGPARPADTRRYRTEHRFADAYLIPEMRRQIQASRERAGLPPLDDVQLAVAAGEQARWVMEGVPRTDLAQRPVEPWSGFVVEPARSPMQMLLAPEVLLPDLHARGRMVEAPPAPRAEAVTPTAPEAPHPGQLSLGFEPPGAPRPVTEVPAGGRPAGEGGTRNQRPLTPEEFAGFAAMAEQMGMPREQIQQVGGPTAYLPGSFDQLLIGPDILPLAPEARPQGLANPANAALEPRAVLGHEIIGHREAELAGQARIEPWHEEFQASTRAALHTPDLPREQMWLLTQDAAARRRHQSREGTIFVDTERYGAPQSGGRRPVRPRAPGEPPSVIVDPSLAGERRVAEPSPGRPQAHAVPPGAVRPPAAGGVASPGALIAYSAAVRGGADRGSQGAPSTAGAPRDTETARSAGFARAARAGAIASLNPAVPMLWGAYFGHGTREERIGRGGSVGAVVGTVTGGPVGAYLGRRVGEGVARRAEDFNAGLERGAEPIVEPVNPAYPPPPGSGSRQDIADLQNTLLGILQARAQAEALQGMMAGDAAHHEANAGPLAEFNQRNAQAISATQAHQEATARRTTANQQQQQQEGSVTGTLQDYGNRAAGLAMITGPLEAFTRFTYLAHALPDSPDVLRGAKRGILKMNSDGQNFLDALSGVDTAVAGQQTAQPARSSGIAANAGRLAATTSGAVASQAGLAQSGGQGQGLAARNAARSADSRQREAQAAQTGAQLDTQAEDTQTRIASLSEQWQSWATAHRQARVDAMARTRAA
ncbi:MAG: hypothetical protein KDH16_23215, partial [Rhodocyclaceae bacterium]|nr:hypothetical protein [Rhodocyclaceae bacterium]